VTLFQNNITLQKSFCVVFNRFPKQSLVSKWLKRSQFSYFKGVTLLTLNFVHPQKIISVIIYSPSSCSKLSFYWQTQKKIYVVPAMQYTLFQVWLRHPLMMGRRNHRSSRECSVANNVYPRKGTVNKANM